MRQRRRSDRFRCSTCSLQRRSPHRRPWSSGREPGAGSRVERAKRSVRSCRLLRSSGRSASRRRTSVTWWFSGRQRDGRSSRSSPGGLATRSRAR